MMIGGDAHGVKHLDPVFADRTPGREGRDPRAEQGYIHLGPIGGGHAVSVASTATFAEKVLSATRFGFGGHVEPVKQ